MIDIGGTPDRFLSFEPIGEDALVELDEYERAFAKLPELAKAHFINNRESLAHFFADTVLPRERHYSKKQN
jgi:hypothetical protein